MVLLFARPPQGVAGVDGAPMQSLVGYRRLLIGVGERMEVEMEVSALDLSYADRAGRRVLPTGEWSVWVGSKGPDDGARTMTLRVGP